MGNLENIHILNGDALEEQFPPSIPGTRIITRECLVDGDLAGDSLSTFFETRASYLSNMYGGVVEEYAEKCTSEFQKICQLPSSNHVHLWFEDDLFCQVNLWFVAHLITHYTNIEEVSLVRPQSDLQFGFGGMSQEELVQAWTDRAHISFTSLQTLSNMWTYYKSENLPTLMNAAVSISSEFPFLIPAVQAQIDRKPSSGLGKPHKMILELLRTSEDQSFGNIFREFNKQAAIYGFGDLQVRRIWEECKSIKSSK